MKTKRLIAIALLLCATLLGCEENELGDINQPWTGDALKLRMCMPFVGQPAVNLGMRPVIAFAEPIDAASVEGRISMALIEDGVEVDLPIGLTVDGPSVWIELDHNLRQVSQYVIHVQEGIANAGGDKRFRGLDIPFGTEGRNPINGARPEVIALLPDIQGIVYDFASFWACFSEPIQTASAVYGQTIKITRDSDGALIPAQIWPSYTVLTIDPLEDFEPGQSYTLSLSSGIVDLNGEPLTEFSRQFAPLSSGARANLTVLHCPSANDSGTPCGNTENPDDIPISPVTGQPFNTFYTDSVLIGGSYNFIGGPLKSIMGDTSALPSISPMILPRGQKIHVSALPVTLGGELDAGVTSGPITLTLTSDVYGFMMGSEYLYGEAGGPPAVYMILDTSLVTEDPTVNAMFNQNVLAAQIVGNGEVNPETGELELVLGSFITLNVLGEQAPTAISLKYVPPANPFDFVVDDEATAVITVGPPPGQQRAPLTEPIVVTFNDVIVPDSLTGKISLGGGRAEGTWKHRGPHSTFYPSEPLDPLTEYTLTIDAGISDLSGNSMPARFTSTFTTGTSEATMEPPILGTTSPGVGAVHPAEAPIDLCFGQAMDLDSVAPGQSVSLVSLDDGSEVEGSWLPGFHQIRFIPNEPLTVGGRYRLTLTDGLTNINGIALDTDVDRAAGGPDVSIEFTASESQGEVPLVLMLMPAADTDDSGYVDGSETATETNSMTMDFALITDPSYSSGTMVAFARGMADQNGRREFMLDLVSGILMHATSTSMSLDLGDDKETGLLDMGRISIAATETGSSNAYMGPGDIVTMSILLNTEFNIENTLLNGFLVHELALEMSGLLSFTLDGRMETLIQGETGVVMEIPIIGPMTIPTAVAMRAITPQLDRP